MWMIGWYLCMECRHSWGQNIFEEKKHSWQLLYQFIYFYKDITCPWCPEHRLLVNLSLSKDIEGWLLHLSNDVDADTDAYANTSADADADIFADADESYIWVFARSTIKDRARKKGHKNTHKKRSRDMSYIHPFSLFVFLTKSLRQGCPREGRWTSGQADLVPHSQLSSIGNWKTERILEFTLRCLPLNILLSRWLGFGAIIY